MGVEINLKIITKNHAADPEKRFLTKSISKPNGRATAMPTALELNNEPLILDVRRIGCLQELNYQSYKAFQLE